MVGRIEQRKINAENDAIKRNNSKILKVLTPESALFHYHQQLFKKLPGIANDKFTESNKNDITSAVLEEMGINLTLSDRRDSTSEFFTTIRGRRGPIPRVMPTLDGKPTTWDNFDAFVKKYAKNPIAMQRLGLDSNGDESQKLTAAKVSARISSNVGGRSKAASRAEKVIKNVSDTNLMQYRVKESTFPVDLELFFLERTKTHIKNNNISLAYSTGGTAFGMELDVADETGTVLERHYIKQSFNPEPDANNTVEDLVQNRATFVPDNIIPYTSYRVDPETSFYIGNTLNLFREFTVVDNTSTDYINYDIGHRIGDATQRLKFQLSVLEKLHAKELVPQIKEGYKEKIARHKDFIQQATLLDNSEIRGHSSLGDLTQLETLQIQRELVKTAGTVKILQVTRQTLADGTRGGLKFNTFTSVNIVNAPTLNQYMVEFSSFNVLKGGKAGAIVEAAYRSLLLPNSTSPATLLLHKMLAKIFDDKNLLKTALQNSTRQKTVITKTIQKLFVPKKVNLKTSTLKKAEIEVKQSINQSKTIKPKGRKASQARVGANPGIVAKMNASLREYVIAEMNYPALQNRSGRLASSAKILSVEHLDQLEATITYTYMKSPYIVFSKSKGKSPWNSPEARDPAYIIDRAIRKMGIDLFNNMLMKTEEN